MTAAPTRPPPCCKILKRNIQPARQIRCGFCIIPTIREKVQALLTGFAAAHDAGCTHAITIDSDGQHLVSDIFRLMQISQLFPDDLIIGDRQMDFADVPTRSKRGRDMSRFWMLLQTGQDVPDTQCGLRIYPLKHTLTLTHIFRRFDFETETLVRHAWAALQVRSAPITCIYFTAENRITHFRPVRDTLRGVRLNVMLTTWRIINPMPCRKCRVSHNTPHVSWRSWSSWRFWKRQLGLSQCDALADAMLATAVGVGVLIAVLPLYGIQTLLALYTARRLHINIPVTLLATQISLPPFIPLLIFMNIQTGTLLLHGRFLSPEFMEHQQLSWHGIFSTYLGPMMLGGLACGLASGTAAVLITRAMLARMHRKLAANPATVPLESLAGSGTKCRHKSVCGEPRDSSRAFHIRSNLWRIPFLDSPTAIANAR